jgi:hypothetical protein
LLRCPPVPQYAEELIATAKAIATPGKGILAADESTGTIGKRVRAYFPLFLGVLACSGTCSAARTAAATIRPDDHCQLHSLLGLVGRYHEAGCPCFDECASHD